MPLFLFPTPPVLVQTALRIALAVIAALLIIVVLLQNRGSGLSATFGGSSTFQATKRGPERFLARATVFFATTFLFLALVVTFWTDLAHYFHLPR